MVMSIVPLKPNSKQEGHHPQIGEESMSHKTKQRKMTMILSKNTSTHSQNTSHTTPELITHTSNFRRQTSVLTRCTVCTSRNVKMNPNWLYHHGCTVEHSVNVSTCHLASKCLFYSHVHACATCIFYFSSFLFLSLVLCLAKSYHSLSLSL